MKTNKIIFLWLLFTPFFCLSQTNDDTDILVKESLRKFYKDGLSLLLKPNEKATYNIYYKHNFFYWEVEIDLRVSDEHFREPNIREMLKNGSYDYGYHMANAFLSFNKDGKKTFDGTDTKYIYINVYFTKSDLSRIGYLYYMKPNDFWVISDYFNKEDFIDILNKRLH